MRSGWKEEEGGVALTQHLEANRPVTGHSCSPGCIEARTQIMLVSTNHSAWGPGSGGGTLMVQAALATCQRRAGFGAALQRRILVALERSAAFHSQATARPRNMLSTLYGA